MSENLLSLAQPAMRRADDAGARHREDVEDADVEVGDLQAGRAPSVHTPSRGTTAENVRPATSPMRALTRSPKKCPCVRRCRSRACRRTG